MRTRKCRICGQIVDVNESCCDETDFLREL